MQLFVAQLLHILVPSWPLPQRWQDQYRTSPTE